LPPPPTPRRCLHCHRCCCLWRCLRGTHTPRARSLGAPTTTDDGGTRRVIVFSAPASNNSPSLFSLSLPSLASFCAYLHGVPPGHHAHGRHGRRRQEGDVRVVVVPRARVAGVGHATARHGGDEAPLRGQVRGPVPHAVQAQEARGGVRGGATGRDRLVVFDGGSAGHLLAFAGACGGRGRAVVAVVGRVRVVRVVVGEQPGVEQRGAAEAPGQLSTQRGGPGGGAGGQMHRRAAQCMHRAE